MTIENESITIIAPSAHIRGDIHAPDGVSVLGIVDGTVTSTDGLVHVGPGARIEGEVDSAHVIIDGWVQGNVTARRSLELNGKITGDVSYGGTVKLGENAEFDGQLSRRKTLHAVA